MSTKSTRPAVGGVAHELLDARDDPARGAAVVARGVPERAVALVDDHQHVADRLHHAEDLLEVALGRPHPLAPEVLELDRGEAGRLREGLGHEGLAGAHRPREQEPHGDPAVVPLADVVRDLHELALHLLHAAHGREVVVGIHELHHAEALALQDLALTLESRPSTSA